MARALPDDIARAKQDLADGNADACINALLAVVRERPEDGEAYAVLGAAWRRKGYFTRQAWAFRKATKFGASASWALAAAIHLEQVQPSADVARGEWRRVCRELGAIEASAERPDGTKLPVGPVMAYFSWAHLGPDIRPATTQYMRLLRTLWPHLVWQAPHCAPDAARRPGPPRVGIIWRFPPNHPVHQCGGYLFDRCVTEGAEVTAYSRPGLPPLTQYGLPANIRRVELVGSLNRQRLTVAQDQLDVLIFPEIGMDKDTLWLAMARLAPRQWVTIGHPVTTGLPNMDVFLSSAAVEAPDADSHYTERLVRLDGFPVPWRWTDPPSRLPDERAALGLPAGNLYALPHNGIKLHPDFDALLASILAADPDGRLVIWDRRPAHTAALMARFQRTLSPFLDRIHWHRRFNGDDFLRYLRAVDVVLDSRPFCTGTTANKSLSVGTPIVTWPGRFYRNRVPFGNYRTLGVMETVVDSAVEYVKIAVHLGTNKAANRSLRARIVAAARVAGARDDLGDSFAAYARGVFAEITASSKPEPSNDAATR